MLLEVIRFLRSTSSLSCAPDDRRSAAQRWGAIPHAMSGLAPFVQTDVVSCIRSHVASWKMMPTV
jgi:hypothetical protein